MVSCVYVYVFVYTEQVTFKQTFLETDSLEIRPTIKCSVTTVWCLIICVCRCSLCSLELFTEPGDCKRKCSLRHVCAACVLGTRDWHYSDMNERYVWFLFHSEKMLYGYTL